MADTTETPELKGVAGWLRLFVIILAVISPIRAVVQTAALLQIDPIVEDQLGSKWTIYEGFTWSLTAATIAATSLRLASSTQSSRRRIVMGRMTSPY